jgi:hypothetical protein
VIVYRTGMESDFDFFLIFYLSHFHGKEDVYDDKKGVECCRTLSIL